MFFGQRLSTIPTAYARNQVLIVRVLIAFDRHNTESIFTLLCLMLVRLMLCFDQYYQQCNMGMRSQTSQLNNSTIPLRLCSLTPNTVASAADRYRADVTGNSASTSAWPLTTEGMSLMTNVPLQYDANARRA